MSLQIRNQLTDLEIKLTVSWGKMEGWGRDREFGLDMYNLLKMDDQQIPNV